jgi:hypothetical protein
MAERDKLIDRARDELFSHINRCGVLQAAVEDQQQWMDETIEYVGERYPDLSDADLKELHAVGIRFCKPAIPHGADADNRGNGASDDSDGARSEALGEAADEAEAVASDEDENTVVQAEDANAA